MARISGVNIPNEKRIEVALTYIYGIGLTSSQKILKKSGVNSNARVKSLSEEDLNKIRKEVEFFRVEGELRRDRASNIKRLKEIRCYRGVRHTKGLPVRGQKTKTNSRTVRGNKRVTMGSGRAPSAQKT
mgnify:CR=1 FL=1